MPKDTMTKTPALLRLFLAVLLLLPAVSQHAEATTADSLFAHMPREVLPLLDKTAKLDLLDLFNSGLKAAAENIYGGQTEMKEKTATHILLRTSESGTWAMDAVAAQGDTLIVCVQSLKAGGVGSRVQVYTRDWRPLPTSLPRLKAKDFVTLSPALSADRMLQMQRVLSACPIEATWDAETETLRVRPSTEGLTEDERRDAKGCLTEKHYALKGTRFVETAAAAAQDTAAHAD